MNWKEKEIPSTTKHQLTAWDIFVYKRAKNHQLAVQKVNSVSDSGRKERQVILTHTCVCTHLCTYTNMYVCAHLHIHTFVHIKKTKKKFVKKTH